MGLLESRGEKCEENKISLQSLSSRTSVNSSFGMKKLDNTAILEEKKELEGSPYMVAHNRLDLQFQVIWLPLLAPVWVTDVHTDKTPICIK